MTSIHRVLTPGAAPSGSAPIFPAPGSALFEVHVVKPGETLSLFARRVGLPLRELLKHNTHLDVSSKLLAAATRVFVPRLREGASGGAVAELQRYLAALGAEVDESGVYDRKTRAAVLAFQRANLPEGSFTPGVIGLETSDAIERRKRGELARAANEDVAPLSAGPAVESALQPGLPAPRAGGVTIRRSAVRAPEAAQAIEQPQPPFVDFGAQRPRRTLRHGRKGPDVELLQRMLNRLGENLGMDGHFGEALTAAVKRFQRANGLEQDGIAGTATWSAIERLARQPRSSRVARFEVARSAFTGEQERNAYDVVAALAHDDPRHMRRVLRLSGMSEAQAAATPVAVTRAIVESLAATMRRLGIPLTSEALEPISAMRAAGATQLGFAEARSISELLGRVMIEGFAIDTPTYDALIRAEAQRTGLPGAFIKAIMAAESGFNPNIRSGAGAEGLMQLMPGTAAEVGVTNRLDPAQSTHGGATYLARLARQLDDNLLLVTAGYNAGPGNVQEYEGVPPFLETHRYLRRVLMYYAYYRATGQPRA